MPKEKQKKAERKKKAGKKGSQLALRLEKSERDAFVALCERLDTSAAREIRRFMREFVAAHGGEAPVPEAAPPDAEAAPEAAAEPEKKPRAPRKPRAAKADGATAQEAPASAPPRRRKAAAEAPAT